MNNSHRFLLKYEGAALADGTMDVAQLAPALISLSNALASLNQIANKDEAKVSLQVHALKKGSFNIDLQLTQDIFAQVESIFNGPGVTAYCNAYTLVSSFIEILLLKKFLKGQKPDQITVSEDLKNVTFVFENSQNT